ncbi:12225_t:CDS:1, partial [Ambispora gerdemannii]
YLENVSEIPMPKIVTNESVTTDNEYIINNITFNERALNHAKNFATSTLEDLEQDKRDINWLILDVDLQLEIESM